MLCSRRGLGRIFDHNAGNDNLDKGSRVEAPLWLGSALAKRNMAEIRCSSASLELSLHTIELHAFTQCTWLINMDF